MKKTLKLLALLSALLLIALFAVSCGTSTAKSAEGSCGENIDWKYDSSKRELTLTGEGEMKKFDSADEVPWKDVLSSAKKLSLDDDITTISDHAFRGAAFEGEVSLPDSLVSLGDFAFAFCTKVEEVEIPDSLESIGKGAFEGCSALEQAYVPASVTELGERAFAFCPALTDAVILSGADLPAELFYNATSLEVLYLNEGIKSIDESAFKNASVDEEDAKPVSADPKDATATLICVDEDGKELDTKRVGDLSFGSNYSISAPAIEGYTPKEATVSGTIYGTDVEHTVVYEKDEVAPADEAEEETDAPKEKKSTTSTVIAIVIFALLLIGIAVAAVLLIRSDKKNQKNTGTVRKNDPKSKK